MNAYMRTRVLSATPEELRLLLLDGAIKFGMQGVEGMERKDYEAMFNGISQCRNIVFELMTTIRTDVNPDVATKVQSLFLFMYKELIDGSHQRDAARIRKVIELLEYERETWVMLMQKLAEERAGQGGGAPSPEPAAGTPRPISVNA
jgi:flagellar protein FliS